MEEKKIKFELSKIGLIFVILFALCVLVWTFILGVWIGTKLGEKPAESEIALKPEKEKAISQALSNQSVTSFTNQTGAVNETTPLENKTVSLQPEGPEKKEPGVVKEETKPVKPIEKAEKKVEEKKKVVQEEKPKYQKQEVAQIATRIKEHGYFIQIGAFSQKEKAEALKEKANKLGFTAQIREMTSEGKTLYKVLIGGYSSRSEAENVLGKVKEKLGIEKPFIVEH